MGYDVLIKNGTLIDGTGSPARHGSIAITNGQIVEVGDIDSGATQIIDADGAVVAPGFIDPHTHYDAQICWDGAVTPSSWHGVTSVVVGNCGVGIAPCRPESRDIAMHDLVNVEAIPYDVLEEGITWDWETFPEYLDALEKLPRTVDVGTHVPHGSVRAYVLGERERPGETGAVEGLADLAACRAQLARRRELHGLSPHRLQRDARTQEAPAVVRRDQEHRQDEGGLTQHPRGVFWAGVLTEPGLDGGHVPFVLRLQDRERLPGRS